MNRSFNIRMSCTETWFVKEFQNIFIIPIPVKIAAMKPSKSIASESSSHEFTGTNNLCRLSTASQTHTINQWRPKPKAVTVVVIKDIPGGMVKAAAARTIQFTVINSRNCPICLYTSIAKRRSIMPSICTNVAMVTMKTVR